MATPNEHVHKEVMIAYANDSSLTIQLWSRESGKWQDVYDPAFNPDVEYRIKPDKNQQLIIAAEREVERARWVLYDAQDEFEEAQDVLARIS